MFWRFHCSVLYLTLGNEVEDYHGIADWRLPIYVSVIGRDIGRLVRIIFDDKNVTLLHLDWV